MAAPAATPPGSPAVGVVSGNVRRLRVQAGLSLSGLAQRAGLGKGSLSQLEQGQGNPTIETLFALAYALNATLADLVEEPEALQPAVVRSVDRPAIPGQPLDARLLHRSVQRGGTVEVYELHVHASAEQRAQGHRPGVIEHVYVLEGDLRIGPDTAEVELQKGDYAHHRADVEHVYASRDGGRALLIMVLPPGA